MVRFRTWVLVCLVISAPQFALAGERLDKKQLTALFSGGLEFKVDLHRRIYFDYRADGTWEGEGGSSAWGDWTVDGARICRALSGGNWSGTHCFGIERRGDDLFYVDSNHGAYEGKELLLDDYNVLSRVDALRPKPADLQKAAPTKEPEVKVSTAPPVSKPQPLKIPDPVQEAQPAGTKPSSPAKQSVTGKVQGKEPRELQRQIAALKNLVDAGLLSEQEFRTKRDAVLNRFLGLRKTARQQPKRSRTDKYANIPFGDYHALVIGINDYTSLTKLKTAIADAREVARVLENDYGYTVHLLENPTREDIIDLFDELRETLTETDNLLIYYAGHGWRDPQSGTGYWLPVNARENRRSRWYSNATLTEALQGLFAKHVMVVADSCYSGTLTRSIKIPDRNAAYVTRMAEKRTRVVLSSGGLEPVEDSGGGGHSVFAKQFLAVLRSNEGVLDGTQLFERIRHKVVLEANQTPQYSDIRFAGHEGGDYLFVRSDR